MNGCAPLRHKVSNLLEAALVKDLLLAVFPPNTGLGNGSYTFYQVPALCWVLGLSALRY